LRVDAGPADRTALPGPRAPTSANTHVAAEGTAAGLDGGDDAEELDAWGFGWPPWVVADPRADALVGVCDGAAEVDWALSVPMLDAAPLVTAVVAPTAVPSLRV
jgi:hypothetical protein